MDTNSYAAKLPDLGKPESHMSSWQKFWLILAVAAVFAITVVGTAGVLSSQGGTSPTAFVAKGAAAATQVPDNPVCDDFTVKLLAHPGGNFSPTPLTPNAPEMARQELLDQNKHEPSSLYGYYVLSPIYGKYPEVKSEKDLVDNWETGSCYSDVGRKLYADWAWYWKQAVLTPRDSMPESGVITGATESGQVFQQAGKINPSTGYDVTYKGFGKEFDHFVRDECTQPGKAGVPYIPGVQPSPPGAPPLVVVPPTDVPPVIVEQCPPGATLPYPQCFPTVTEQCPPGAPLPYPVCFPTVVEECPPGAPLPYPVCYPALKDPHEAPGNGGAGTGGFGHYGGDGPDRHQIDGPASAPAVVPHDTVAPTSRPTPPVTRTQAPVVTPTFVAPPAQQTTAAPSTEPRQTVEVVAPSATAPTGGNNGGADEGACPASNPLCG